MMAAMDSISTLDIDAAYQVLRNNEPPSKALREIASAGR